MDDDCKDYRRNKPQQKFYKPGSGPLRRSSYGLDTKMDPNDIDNGTRRYRRHYGSQYSVNDDMSDTYSEKSVSTNNKQNNKKHDKQLYVPRSGDSYSDNDKQSKASIRYDNSSQDNNRSSNKPDKHGSNSGTIYTRRGPKRDRSYGNYHRDGSNNNLNYNRQYRQPSETRSISPTQCVQEKNINDHNRDSRSMETTGHHMTKGGKPPSGRRNSAGYMSDNPRHKYMVNIDNVPPRFRKKFLEQSGHHNYDNKPSHSSQSSYNDYAHNSGSNWSQTLPSRGRGRLRENENFDKDKFINNYLKSSDPHSNSYMNLYDSSTDQRFKNEQSGSMSRNVENAKEITDTPNGITNESSIPSNQKEPKKQDGDVENDSKPASQTSTSLEVSNLDWTEEVEKNIKLDDVSDTSISFSQTVCNAEEIKPVQLKEETKRSARSRRKDRRSSSRGLRNSDKRDRNKKDSTASAQHNEPERPRKESNASIQHETLPVGLRNNERERRDSHRSNRSSTIGNSRDDLDRWRSLRSYSREQSTEGRIVSQCNSRDVSGNRALSPRDNDGFRVPSSVNKTTTWPSGNQNKNHGNSGPRTSSIERVRQTPVREGEGGAVAGNSVSTAPTEGTSSRRSRRGPGRRRARNNDGHATTQPTTTHSTSSAPTNWREEILESKRHTSHDKHSEGVSQSNRLNSNLSDKSEPTTSYHPGLIMLPQSSISTFQKELGRVISPLDSKSKTLFDHQNPSKPIIVQTSPMKMDMRLERGNKEISSRISTNYENNEVARADRHRTLLQEVDRADAILQTHLLKPPILLAEHWNDITPIRTLLQNSLQRLLMSDLKYCQEDNVEHHFWKILYHNFIEMLRKSIPQMTAEEKPKIVKLINTIIDEGNAYFENLVQILEKAYKFNVDDYINDNHVIPPKGLGYIGLALISVQKLYVSLGDLARYREQVNETNNYAKSKLWYTKAQQINPKNGRPYNQLAILAIYARRKLDAVYYYMRSLMSSNPFQSARESLLSLFHENRKKYEAAERKRRATIESAKSVDVVKGGGAYEGTSGGAVSGVRRGREVWVLPGERSADVTRVLPDPLDTVSSVELNKTFITSYLHVHGKMITKIGMETFYESASLMLRQFRALLHRQPLPMPAARLLQLTALNMFAVETTTASHKGGEASGERSAWLECALGVSLLMFGALVERCCVLLPEPTSSQHHADALLLLPAIKVWSDWMLCHSSVWNPPLSFNNFDTDFENGPWDWLAKLMNILEALDDKSVELENEMRDGYTCVRLAEDSTLGGFTPLMYMEPAVAWARTDPAHHHTAEHVLRTRKLLFFGTEYLVGVEPPVLRLEYPADAPPRYASAVLRAQPDHPPLQHLMEELEDADSASEVTSGPTSLSEGVDSMSEVADEATRRLLRRKEHLETRKATLERHKQRMQEILHSGLKVTEVEVRPRWLVPDTNCFIDHLPLLQAVVAAQAQPYTLAVPLVVMTELEGLRKCSRVGGAAQSALEWVSSGGAGVRLVTSRGSLLASRAFTVERDHERVTNDDRVLATALNLHANLVADTESHLEVGGGDSSKCIRLVREVVLLTDDRNLRVKALAAELPTRDLPSFVQWAGLCSRDKGLTSSKQDEVAATR